LVRYSLKLVYKPRKVKRNKSYSLHEVNILMSEFRKHLDNALRHMV